MTPAHEGPLRYVGWFESNKKHGQGTYTCANGDKYVGAYENDKKHGQGTITLTGGSVYYSGNWKDNEPVEYTRYFGDSTPRSKP